MNNPGLTGLQSLQQHGVAVPGETKNIEYFFNLAKKMSDGQLADVLAGKSLNVPQFVAMTEAMGRKQLRQAVDGAQAMQQAKQPSVKDQLLAEQSVAGLDQLPAPNMESMDMASGGIVAFDRGGDVYDRWKNLATDEGEGINNLLDPVYGWLTNRYGEEAKARRLEREKQAALKSVADTTFVDDTIDPNLKIKPTAATSTAPTTTASTPATTAATTNTTAVSPTTTSTSTQASPTVSTAMPDYLSGLAGTGERIRGGIADIKKAKESDFLLGASKALLGNATLAKAGSDFAGTAMELGAKTRKEVRELEQAADAYDFNMAKAREARAQGNKELELKHLQLADLNRYHMGSLGIQSQKLGILKDQYDTVKIPAQLSKVYADAKKEIDAAYNNMVPASKRAQYQKDIEDAYRKRAASVGLGKYVDLYSPSAPAYNVVQSPRKGANVLDLDES